MIRMTDNLYEARKFVLKDFIKEGYKYIARDKDGEFYAYSNKPVKRDECWIFDEPSNTNSHKNISLVSFIFPDIEWEDVEPFRIPHINWKEVPVDTPMVYTNCIGEKLVRYFCKYDEENDRVVLYIDGRTSLTEQGIIEAYPERVSIYEKEKN